MTPETAINNIRELSAVVKGLRGVYADVSGVNVGKYSKTGKNRWKGVHHDQFITRHEEAEEGVRNLRTAVMDAILECKSRMETFATHIDFSEHPIWWGDAKRRIWFD